MDQQIPEKEALLEELRAHAPRAMHVGELCGRLGVARSERDEVVRRLLLLAENGAVQEMPGLRFRAVSRTDSTRRRSAKKKRSGRRRSAASDLTPLPAVEVGQLAMTRQGYGFVNLFDGNPDVFIPPDAVGPALHGDQVQVRAHPTAKGREGRIVGIVERRDPRVTGTLRSRGRGTIFEPDDPRLRSPMRVVGRPPKGALRGKVVLAEIVNFPQKVQDRAEVRVDEILGAQGVARIEVERIKIREGVVEQFPEEVKQEARALPLRVERGAMRGREDFRSLDLVTIDPETARDHDDAVWVERHGEGYRAVVAIADVSHYVSEGSAIDREAASRGTSVYLPDRAIPMLPEELSSNLASLIPHRDRLCIAVEIHLDDKAHVTSHRVVEGIMRSGAKLTYEGVARALGLTKRGQRQPAAEKRVRALKSLLELSKKLRARRIKRGALEFDLPEPKIILDPVTEEPVSIVQSRKDPGVREAYRLIEDMMLLTNEVVAAHLKRHTIPSVFRIHGTPDAEKIEAFREVARAFGHELSEDFGTSSRQMSRFLRRTEGAAEAPVLHYLLLRAMQQAMYDTDPTVGHFALATKDYLHFTSPIRRYPDLLVHRVIRDVIRGKSIDAAALRTALQRSAAQASEAERRTLSVERDVLDVYRAIYMQDHVGEQFEGRVSGFASFGIFVQIEDPFVSVQLPFEQLEDTFEPDKLGIRLIGQRTAKVFTINDRVVVRIEDANVRDREVIGSLTEHEQSTRPRPQRRKQPARRRERPRSRRRA